MTLAAPRRLAVRIFLRGALLGTLACAVVMGLAPLILDPPLRRHERSQLEFVLERVCETAPDRASLQRLLLRTPGQVALYDAAGKLIAASPTPPPSSAPPLARRDDFVELDCSGLPGTKATARVPPPPIPGTDLLFLVASAGVVLALLSTTLARSIAAPIERLAGAARALGQGDLSVRSAMTRSDEIGDLSRAFNDMAERLATAMRAQKELLANVSHELRTPTARVRVLLEMIEENPDALSRYVPEIVRDLGELERVIDEILTSASLDLAGGRPMTTLPLRKAQVSTRGWVDQAVARFASRHPEVHLTTDVAETHFVGDVVLLLRLLGNLLENAWRYSEPPATVHIAVSLAADKQVRLSVSDRGVGIQAEEVSRVLEPFFRGSLRTSHAKGGIGLGLTLALRIVEAHDGAVAIESAPGLGTTIRCCFPASPRVQSPES
jgi:signal transduction histidine kinase